MDMKIRLHDLNFVPLISEEEVSRRTTELGKELFVRLGDKNPLFIVILNGAFMFAADLVRAYNEPCEMAFVRLSSYSGTTSSGTVTASAGLNTDIAGRHVVIVEDIVDTGRTLHVFLDTLAGCQPASVTLTAFLRKPEAQIFPIQVDLTGFDIENKFVVGYGLDYDQLGRNLPGVWVLESQSE